MKEKTKISDMELSGVTGGADNCGGICGTVTGNNTTLENCNNSTKPTGEISVGGICGTADGNTAINNCNNIGAVKDKSVCVGGIVGKI